MSDEGTRFTFPPSKYLLIDRLTKIAGVAFVAVGLEVGGHTVTGVLLGAVGVLLALFTVFLEPADVSSDSQKG